MDIDALAEAVFASVKAYCDEQLAKHVQAAIKPLEEQLKSMPMPAAGEKGDRGDDGRAGERGQEGEKGDRGEQGLQGPAGERGSDGVDGKDGAPGKDGESGPQGDDGFPGAPGEAGRDGRDGKEGPPGRDALHIEVLDSIDEQRGYARGTYARHRGGLIRAARKTDPITGNVADAGWQILIDPVVDIEVVQSASDARVFSMRGITAFGRGEAKSFRLPVMVYRGVFVDGQQYDRGDTTTWGGSLWHCDDPTTEKPGEGSKAWRLAAKRGRDGKDGLPGAKGERGADARATH